MARAVKNHQLLELHPKVAAASIGTLIGTIALWLLSLAGVNPPADVATAITGLIAATLAYFAPWMATPQLGNAAGEKTMPEAPVTSISRGPIGVSAS